MPCWISIDGSDPIKVPGPGGRLQSSYFDGGQDPAFRFPFRVPASAFGEDGPKVGQAVTWLRETGEDFVMEITEFSVRTSEGMWPIACKHQRS